MASNAMVIRRESHGDFQSTCARLEKVVPENKFGVLHMHDVLETLKKKGIACVTK
jgi:uncharacterized protein (DUF302 family)